MAYCTADTGLLQTMSGWGSKIAGYAVLTMSASKMLQTSTFDVTVMRKWSLR